MFQSQICWKCKQQAKGAWRAWLLLEPTWPKIGPEPLLLTFQYCWLMQLFYLVWKLPESCFAYNWSSFALAHQNRTIAIASDFRVDGAKSPEIPQQEGVLGSEIAARNRRSLATFHRNLKSQCSINCCLLSRKSRDFWGPRWASQSQIATIAAILVR